jgi:hypothetical protein
MQIDQDFSLSITANVSSGLYLTISSVWISRQHVAGTTAAAPVGTAAAAAAAAAAPESLPCSVTCFVLLCKVLCVSNSEGIRDNEQRMRDVIIQLVIA